MHSPGCAYVEADVIDDTLLSGKLSQLLRFFWRDGQRFLAVHILAILKCCFGHFIMECIRRSNIDEIDLRIRDKFMPVRRHTAEANLMLRNLSAFLIVVGNHLKDRYTEIRSEQHLLIEHCCAVCLAHPTCTNEANTNLFHFLLLLDLYHDDCLGPLAFPSAPYVDYIIALQEARIITHSMRNLYKNYSIDFCIIAR